MSVDAGIACSTSQIFVLAIGDVEMRFGVAVLFGETEVNHIDLITAFPNAHQEVVRLNVTMNEGLCVNVLDSR